MTYHRTTTLAEIRAEGPCEDGWGKLLKYLGKTKADNEPLDLLTILDSNGLDDALWCLRAASLERLSRHFQAWCAEQVLPVFESDYPEDMRARNQIAMLRRDDATPEERAAAFAAAHAAASAAAWAAAHAAFAAAHAFAARDAALAARAAARDAAWAAAWDARAARAAARDAAWAAAWDARAARAAARDARAAARDAQERQLRKMLAGEA